MTEYPPNPSRQERADELFKASGVPGRKPLKRLRVKIFQPGNKRHKVVLLEAGKGRMIIPGHELGCLEPVIAMVEKNHPFDEFSLVQVGRGDFNIVWRGRKPIQPEEILALGVPLGEVTTVTLGA